MMLSEWARQWGVPAAALNDLKERLLNLDGGSWTVPAQGVSEAAVQASTRLAGSKQGMRLWRNNVGAFHDQEKGVHVRFGLANDSPQVNSVVKSGDLIGIRPRLIQPSDVGNVIGQFVSFECKHSGWHFTGTEREVAQQNWATLILALGGEARFINDASQV